MLESKSSALTSLAIPLHNLVLPLYRVGVIDRLDCIDIPATKYVLQPSSAASGCRCIALAVQAFQCAGTCFSTSLACDSCSKLQNTQAPDPVILASPNCCNHFTASPTAG